jgi:hypothetical protein
MPVMLTTTEEFDLWLEGETAEALKLQRPLPDGMLDIVARGENEDPPVEVVAVLNNVDALGGRSRSATAASERKTGGPQTGWFSPKRRSPSSRQAWPRWGGPNR